MAQPNKGLKPLPEFLVQRYHGWLKTDHSENQAWYQRLQREGQRPRCMVVSCCDSRVQVTDLFGATPGEFFVHRNIANLVPPCEGEGAYHGTSAAIEFAVRELKIANLVVVGHSQCGGAKGCYDMCMGRAPALEEKESFVGRWLDILRPGYERAKELGDDETVVRAMEKETVAVSLDNLPTFPFVKEALDSGALALHGLWIDIASGEMQELDPASRAFRPL